MENLDNLNFFSDNRGFPVPTEISGFQIQIYTSKKKKNYYKKENTFLCVHKVKYTDSDSSLQTCCNYQTLVALLA